MNREEIPNPDRTPVYNIKAVARMVGLQPVTLRAWERRYGLPTPQRGDQGYRLYSDYDVRTLRWLLGELETGMNIGRAAGRLQELRDSGQDPATPALSAPGQPQTLLLLQGQFVDGLLNFDARACGDVLRRAFGLYPLDQVLDGLLRPALVAIGDGWRAGTITVAVEHFAAQFCRQSLMGLLAGCAPPVRPGVIVAACAPGEQHELGLLMLVAALRWYGFDVRYLGPDLPLANLDQTLAPLRPALLLFSATRLESARALGDLPRLLAVLPDPAPRVILGGQAFHAAGPEIPLPYPRLDGPLPAMLRQLEMALAPGR